jgi:hypothetical protein
MFDEYRFWGGGTSAALSGNPAQSTAFLRRAIDGRRYRHLYWPFVKRLEAAEAGIPMNEYEAVVSGCRVAVIYLKHALITAQDGIVDNNGLREAGIASKACERRR